MVSRIGSAIAAACTGEIVSDMIGTIRPPAAPSPPFEIPESTTATPAAA